MILCASLFSSSPPFLKTKGDERTESLQDALRDEGSVNKAIAEELDVLLVVRGQSYMHEGQYKCRQETRDAFPGSVLCASK